MTENNEIYLPYISGGVEGTDKTVGSRDDLTAYAVKEVGC